MSDITMTYDKTTSRAVLTFANGRKLKLAGVSEEQARDFITRHGAEFERRDCVLHTSGEVEAKHE